MELKELKELDKLMQSKAIRTELRELYEDCIDAAEFGISDGEIRSKIVQLTSQLQELEQSIRKNEK